VGKVAGAGATASHLSSLRRDQEAIDWCLGLESDGVIRGIAWALR